MEYLKFPKKSYYLTQGFGVNTYSHKRRKALDVSARSGYKEIYAPFSGYVAKIFVRNNASYTIWLVSNGKVVCADGKKRYAVVMMTHPNGIINYKVGQTFKENDFLFNDGTTGGVKAHLDFEVAVYDTKNSIDASWHYELGGNGLNNSVDPTKYMVISDDTKIVNTYYQPQNKNYIFKKISEVKAEPENSYSVGNYKTLYNMYVRTGPGVNYAVKKVKNLTRNGKENSVYKNDNSRALYKKGTIFTANMIINNDSIWAKTPSGYICLKDKDLEYAVKL